MPLTPLARGCTQPAVRVVERLARSASAARWAPHWMSYVRPRYAQEVPARAWLACQPAEVPQVRTVMAMNPSPGLGLTGAALAGTHTPSSKTPATEVTVRARVRRAM